MKVVTAAEMREIDRITIQEQGLPALLLMERAGLAVAARAMELYPQKRFLVLCGSGNNGGDGLVAARAIHNQAHRVKALILAKQESLSPDCRAQLQLAKKSGVEVEFRKALTSADLHAAVVIDAVLGTGLSKEVTGDLSKIFRQVNDSGQPVIAADIASGISSDTGQVLGDAIRAEHTVTFGLPKRGHYLYPGAEYTGTLHIEDIGFSPLLTSSDTIKTALINSGLASSLLPVRSRSSYKGDYGHLLVVAGSDGKTGAALMTAEAGLRSGSGLVTLGVPETLLDILQGRVLEEMTISLDDRGDGSLAASAAAAILNLACSKADVIAIGPGIGVTEDTSALMKELVLCSTVPLVIDADGLNALHDAGALLSRAKAPIVITPHPGEMARLLKQKSEVGSKKAEVTDQKTYKGSKVTIQDIEADRIGTAVAFAKEAGVYVVLKGVPTIVATPEGEAFINTTGNPGMATAGSGDVLTGIIASLIGQGIDPATAAALGVYLHGLAGDIAASEVGEYSLIASDIIASLPEAFKSLI